VKLIKIFNIYLYILKAIVVAAVRNEPAIYNLDMTDLEDAMDEFIDVMHRQSPKSLFTRFANQDVIVKTYEDAVDKLSLRMVQGLTLLTTTLDLDDRFSGIKYDLKQTAEFRAIFEPLSADDCGNLDLTDIFTKVQEKIKTLQRDLVLNKKKIVAFQREQHVRESLAKQICKDGETLSVPVPPFGSTCVPDNKPLTIEDTKQMKVDSFDLGQIPTQGGSKKTKRRKRTKKRKTNRYNRRYKSV
jgi:hypothetical protein